MSTLDQDQIAESMALIRAQVERGRPVMEITQDMIGGLMMSAMQATIDYPNITQQDAYEATSAWSNHALGVMLELGWTCPEVSG